MKELTSDLLNQTRSIFISCNVNNTQAPTELLKCLKKEAINYFKLKKNYFIKFKAPEEVFRYNQGGP